MPTASTLLQDSVCDHCHHRRPLTLSGWCTHCVTEQCDLGNGPAVGLPVPDDLDLALRLLDEHVRDCPFPATCWTCALLTAHCGECGQDVDRMHPDDDMPRHRLIVARWVAVACEGYVTPALRQAALMSPTAL